MSLAVVYSRASLGTSAPLVTVEVHLSNGLPSFSIVGLAETAVKESRDRVRSALKNSGFDFPTRRITVGLAPADLPKRGGRFDLPIALGILVAAGQLSLEALQDIEFLAELGLGGELRPVDTILSAAVAATTMGHAIALAPDDVVEASRVRTARLLPAVNLSALVDHLAGVKPLNWTFEQPVFRDPAESDLSGIKGQAVGLRGLEVAAAGGHGLIMMGPPGCGKSILAAHLPGLLPAMSHEEALETAMVYSLTGHTRMDDCFLQRPFRAPHHSATAVALIGGGNHPQPGEISLAHNGVLFLDELTEFPRSVLEQLREPLESGGIVIARGGHALRFPCRFQLVAAMNPCPCGYYGDRTRECYCTPAQLQRYRARLSGPLLDRIDLQVMVSRVTAADLTRGHTEVMNGGEVAKRIRDAHQLQFARSGMLNAHLTGVELNRVCVLDDDAARILNKGIDTFSLSARAYHHVLRISRTLADLENETDISRPRITEALAYRMMDHRPKVPGELLPNPLRTTPARAFR